MVTSRRQPNNAMTFCYICNRDVMFEPAGPAPGKKIGPGRAFAGPERVAAGLMPSPTEQRNAKRIYRWA